MTRLFVAAIIYLTITVVLCTYRAVKGPSPEDRLIAVNVIGTKTAVLIAIVSFILKETYFLDVALVYALISFMASMVIADTLEKRGGRVD